MKRSILFPMLVAAMIASSWAATAFAQPSGRRPSGRDPSAMIERFKSLDKDRDGKVSKAEAQGPPARMFTRLDRNGDGFVDAKELKAMANRGRGDSSRGGTGPAAGKPAPDFTLKSLDGKQEVKLSSFTGQRPVALIFGSYTWPPFRRQAGALEAMYKKHKDDVEFYIVYIREAHPTDGWQIGANTREKILYEQPKSFDARVDVAEEMCSTLKFTIPTLIDGIDNKVGESYAGMPDRLYLVGKDGKIAYQGARGPFGFKPDELAAAIKKELAE